MTTSGQRNLWVAQIVDLDEGDADYEPDEMAIEWEVDKQRMTDNGTVVLDVSVFPAHFCPVENCADCARRPIASAVPAQYAMFMKSARRAVPELTADLHEALALLRRHGESSEVVAEFLKRVG